MLLSEQLIGKNTISRESDLGVANDIVCFTFQHAPQGEQKPVVLFGIRCTALRAALILADILEQAGISWPIRNPLYLASDMHGPQMSQLSGRQVVRPLLSQPSPSMFMRSRNTDPFTRPSTDPLHVPDFPRPVMGSKMRRLGLWDSSLDDSSYDDLSMDSWSTKRTGSHSTLDTSMPDMLYAAPMFRQPGDAWTMLNTPHDLHAGKNDGSKQTQREKGARQVVVTLREDQLGQLV